jgi:hypothetical protein
MNWLTETLGRSAMRLIGVIMLAVPVAAHAQALDGDTLYLFNWSNYIPSSLSPNAASAPLLPADLRPIDSSAPDSYRLVNLPVLTPAQEKLFDQIWTQA